MTSPPISPGPGNEEFWRDFLTKGDGREHRLRTVLRRLPSGPRCKLCAAPFGGPLGTVMRAFGKYPSSKDPLVCNSCFAMIEKYHGGAEIECSLLFADIRGSTTMAESMGPGAFHDLLDRFYRTATEVVFDHDGGVDKFVGDEVVAFFFPLMSGERHAERAVAAGRALLRATGHGSDEGPWISIGAGVNTGPAWVGAVGDTPHVEITAVGDSVNVTARLASAAVGGELLVTIAAAQAAGLDITTLESRVLDLKGKEQSTEVVSLGAT